MLLGAEVTKNKIFISIYIYTILDYNFDKNLINLFS